MAKIKQLSAQEAQKIAAGEVVERPCNVVKELIENSIDAGSTQITLYLKDGGKELIRIIDNGCGMSAEDARLSIKHHATSKLTSVSDLESLTTFGFRGEALSSISSVSKVILTTKESHEPAGITLTIDQGVITHEAPASCNTGTDIAIHELFYNVPARKKFLKTKETEWRAIVQLFYAFCLDYPSIHFKLYSENKLIHNFPSACDLKLRLQQLYEQSLAQSLLFFEAQEDRMNIKITGAMSDSSYTRYDRNSIFLFVNQRWVKNYKLSQAFIKGYQNILPTDRYPAGFIFITIEPNYVDINIHPRKEEVQFLHPRVVETTLELAVKQRLEQKHTQALGVSAPQASPQLEAITPVIKAPTAVPAAEEPQKNVTHIQEQDFLHVLNQVFDIKPEQSPALHTEQLEQKPLVFTAGPEKTTSTFNYKLIGQVLVTYIIIETQEGLVLIDQHAAHERILYEHIRTQFNTITRVKLLFPQIVSLTKNDIELLGPYLALFTHYGLVIEQISASELIVQETPVFLKNQPVNDIIKQVVSWISESNAVESSELQKLIQEKIHASLSCKAAIKCGDILTLAAMHELIKDLYSTENKLTCPHGRPTLWQITTGEIEKKFKRNYK